MFQTLRTIKQTKAVLVYFYFKVVKCQQNECSCLYQLLLVVEVRHQDIFSIRDPGERNPQAPIGLMMAFGWKRAPQHKTHYLHQVKGRMHGTKEALPCLFSNLKEACTSLSCRSLKKSNQISRHLHSS